MEGNLVAVLDGAHAEHAVIVQRKDGLRQHMDRRRADVDHGFGSDAVPQLEVGIGQVDLDREGPGGIVGGGRDVAHSHRGLEPELGILDAGLGHRGHEQHRVELDDGGAGLARGEHAAHAGHRIADRAGDVGLDDGAVELELGALQLRLRALELRLDGERGVGRRDALLDQRQVRVIGGLRLVDRGLGLVDGELAGALVERAQRIAGFDFLALLDRQRLHDAGSLGDDTDARAGLGATAQRHFDRHVLGGHHFDAHRTRRGVAAARFGIALGDGLFGVDVTFLLGMLIDARAIDRIG